MLYSRLPFRDAFGTDMNPIPLDPSAAPIFGIAGFCIALLVSVELLIVIHDRAIRSYPMTWALWFIVTSIAAAEQLRAGAGAPAWYATAIACGCLVNGLRTVRREDRDRTRADWPFLGMAIVAVPLWLLTDAPMLCVGLLALANLASLAWSPRNARQAGHDAALALNAALVVLAALSLRSGPVSMALAPAVAILAGLILSLVPLTLRPRRRSRTSTVSGADMQARWQRYLYESHPEAQLRAWAKRLALFRFFRAYGGHAGDGDALVVVYRYASTDDLEALMASLGIVLQRYAEPPPQAERGVTYTGAQMARFPPLIPDSTWLRQPGHTRIGGRPAVVWCSRDTVTISVASGYDVTEDDVRNAEAIEAVLAKVTHERIDPPQDNAHYICPKFYPEFFR